MSMMKLTSRYAFYGAYHNNKWNKLIHIVFVWPILFSALLLLHYVNIGALGPVTFPVPFAVAAFYAFFYILLDVKVGVLAAFLIEVCHFSAGQALTLLGKESAWKVALVIQVICWTSQFLGHGIFEKRAPALFDNLVQAFLMAPFFVLLEVVEFLFGYEPYRGFRMRVDRQIEEKIRKFRAEEEKKRRKRIRT